MTITCDRCRKVVTGRRVVRLKHEEFTVAVTSPGASFGDAPDLCSACLVEIARNGEVVEPESLFEESE
jgi:hypothetical protein